MPRPQDFRINGLDELQPRRILCCQLRQIGDVLMLTPSLEMLRKRFPDAEIDVYTEQKCAPVLENNPDIHHIWALERGKSLLHDLRFYHQVGTGGGKRYDIVIDFQQLPRIRWALAFSDARVRFSYPPPWYNRPFYTHWAPVSGPYAAKSKAGILMNGFGMQWENLRPRLYLTAAEHEAARAELAAWGLKPSETLITVDPSHRRITRRWPAGHYGRLLALIAAQRANLRFLMLFGPGEEDLAAETRALAEAAGLPKGCIILPPRLTSLREMAAMQAEATLHLGNCSSPRHFAVAVGTPSFTVRGSTSTAWTYPGPGHEDMALGLPCQPCSENTCSLGIKCLHDLLPEAVLPRVLNLLDRALAGEFPRQE